MKIHYLLNIEVQSPWLRQIFKTVVQYIICIDNFLFFSTFRRTQNIPKYFLISIRLLFKKMIFIILFRSYRPSTSEFKQLFLMNGGGIFNHFCNISSLSWEIYSISASWQLNTCQCHWKFSLKILNLLRN